jgi:hypothetical protein
MAEKNNYENIEKISELLSADNVGALLKNIQNTENKVSDILKKLSDLDEAAARRAAEQAEKEKALAEKQKADSEIAAKKAEDEKAAKIAEEAKKAEAEKAPQIQITAENFTNVQQKAEQPQAENKAKQPETVIENKAEQKTSAAVQKDNDTAKTETIELKTEIKEENKKVENTAQNIENQDAENADLKESKEMVQTAQTEKKDIIKEKSGSLNIKTQMQGDETIYIIRERPSRQSREAEKAVKPQVQSNTAEKSEQKGNTAEKTEQNASVNTDRPVRPASNLQTYTKPQGAGNYGDRTNQGYTRPQGTGAYGDRANQGYTRPQGTGAYGDREQQCDTRRGRGRCKRNIFRGSCAYYFGGAYYWSGRRAFQKAGIGVFRRRYQGAGGRSSVPGRTDGAVELIRRNFNIFKTNTLDRVFFCV